MPVKAEIRERAWLFAGAAFTFNIAKINLILCQLARYDSNY